MRRSRIRCRNRRTTITADIIVSELLAAKLGENVPDGNRISQDARQYAIEALADKTLMSKVWEWRLEE